jgi:ring-1,2-phenylacetyl-CoA epoxidase subunit PaaC
VNALATYALRLGDDALILSQRLGEWTGSAPELEEDIALTNIALDLLGQARALLTYAGEVEGAGRTEDDLAYLRDERDFTNCQLVEQPNDDFAVTIARQLIFSAYQFELYGALQGSTDTTLAGVAGKAVKEVAYHRDHARQWILRLGDGTAESHERMQRGLERMWPYGYELLEPDPLLDQLSGIAVEPATLRPSYEYVMTVVAEATLSAPDIDWHPTGGRQGMHTEHMGRLLAEMQHIHRSHVGATW